MTRTFKRFIRGLSYGQKGFTLIELLVVVAILGILAAVAIPNVGKFINKGKSEAYETELHNIQTAVMAMLVDSGTGLIATAYDGQPTPTNDMDDIRTTDGLQLSSYAAGLKADGTTQTGCSYAVGSTADDMGKVTQTLPPP